MARPFVGGGDGISDEDLDLALMAKHQALVAACRPVLAGAGHAVQGGVLADLVSLWVAGHHPDVREEVLEGFIKLVRDITPESAKELYAGRQWIDGELNG